MAPYKKWLDSNLTCGTCVWDRSLIRHVSEIYPRLWTNRKRFIKKILDIFLPPFEDSPRVKPSEMLYIAHEKPPISVTLIAGMQHALIAMMLVITGTDIGLSDGSLRGFIYMGVVVMGFGTVLNGLNTRVSAGHLLVFIPGTMTMMVFIPVVNTFGLSAAAGGPLSGRLRRGMGCAARRHHPHRNGHRRGTGGVA